MNPWKPEPTIIMQEAFRHAYKTLGPGLCLEFGVGMGHSFCWQAMQIRDWAAGCYLIGFDSFKGLPAETSGVWAPERHGKGHFCYPMEVLKEHLQLCGLLEPNGVWKDRRYQVVEGFFDESLTEERRSALMNTKIPLTFVNIDVDIHKSTIQALDFIYPMMKPGLVIYFDDYRDPIDDLPGVKDPQITEWGENLAWREWTERNNVSYVLGETNNLNQRYYIVKGC